MRFGQLVHYYAIWGTVGCAVFNVFVVVVFRTGMVWAARDETGALKKKQSWQGILSMLTVPVGIAGLYLLSNGLGLLPHDIHLTFPFLWLINYGYYVILLIYDTIVIDYLVLSKWRPDFLGLPEMMNEDSMGEHIWKSLPVGMISGIIISFLGTLLSCFLLF